MSLKLLIADDEYFIRQRIKKIIPWEKLNLIFAGEAENGQQVIDHLERTRRSAASGYQNAAYERNRNCQIYQRAFSFCAYPHFIGL